MLGPIRACLDHSRIDVPSGPSWDFRDGTIIVDVPCEALAKNLQAQDAAAPCYALCLAWWLEQATGRPTRARINVSGATQPDGKQVLHWRRSLFVLDRLSALLPERFGWSGPSRAAWSWPTQPVMNRAVADRSRSRRHGTGSEHDFELAIVGSTRLRDTFPEPITGFQRQLPVGVFTGAVGERRRWTPGGASQVDIWAVSADSSTVHLVELKKPEAKPLGILPEALYYHQLLQEAARRGVPGLPPALSAGARIAMWLCATDYHPLVLSRGMSPLHWLRSAGVDIRVLPYLPKRVGIGVERWVSEAIWPAAPRGAP